MPPSSTQTPTVSTWRSATRERRALRSRALVAALIAAALGSGCLLEDGPGYDPIDVLVPSYTEDEEREIGMQFDRALQGQVRVIHDPVVIAFLDDLGQSIVRSAEPQPFVYRFRVIDAPSLNAFAVFGGYIYVHSGTLLAASSVDELAGVLGHEVAHVRMRHHARMQEKTKIPDMLASIGGIAASAATGEAGIGMATQSVNQALKLHFSREFEAEADHHGTLYMAEAGYDPAGIARFFQRIMDEQKDMPDGIPPYLYSHPEVDRRIGYVEAQASRLEAAAPVDPALQERMVAVQARLAQLLDQGRASLIDRRPGPHRARTDFLLQESREARENGDGALALDLLGRAEAGDPNDPRVHFHTAELLFESGRHTEAIGSYHQTIRLDPTHALVFYRLGESHKALGERERAVFAFEQAALRAGEKSSLRARADWEVIKLTFRLIEESGLADGVKSGGADTPLGASVESFSPGATRLAWWGKLGLRFQSALDRMRVRWRDPSGGVAGETPVVKQGRPYVGATLELPAPGAASGRWTLEVLIDEDVIERRDVPVRDSPRTVRQ
jgi:predicted Zn-dependent protease